MWKCGPWCTHGSQRTTCGVISFLYLRLEVHQASTFTCWTILIAQKELLFVIALGIEPKEHNHAWQLLYCWSYVLGSLCFETMSNLPVLALNLLKFIQTLSLVPLATYWIAGITGLCCQKHLQIFNKQWMYHNQVLCDWTVYLFFTNNEMA